MKYEYKPSNISWINKFPNDWDIQRARHIFSFSKGLSITKEDLIDDGINVISYGQIHSKNNIGICTNDSLIRWISDVFLRTNPQSLVYENDFIFADTSEDLSGVGNYVLIDLADKTFAGYHTIILRLSSDAIKYCNPKYIAYQFMTDFWRNQLRSKATGIKLYSITQKILRESSVVLPSYNEQNEIVKFLDSKYFAIDKLLKDMQQQIDTLQKYKKSIIYEAVTKGINKSVSYSSVDNSWLKKVPSHWKTERLKYSFRIKKDIAGTLGYDVLAVTQQGIKIKDITINSGQLASDYSKYQLVNVGDYVMNHMDLLTGFMDCSQYVGVTSPDYRVFVPTVDINRTYYTYVFQLCYLAKVFYGLGQGVSTLGRWRMPADAFNNFIIPIPPVEEQHKIAEYLNNKVSKIDAIITEKEKAIAALKAYEKSLIYEYVTGKKRVKEVVAHAD